ncbi:hypothetical protein CPB86DRAFT_869569 [Serendipita vermifera]|nr:hypothetical protein CPB86DRAFT_869569 [Serendipita vermifera]
MGRPLSIRSFSANLAMQRTPQGQINTVVLETAPSLSTKSQNYRYGHQQRSFGSTSNRGQEVTGTSVKTLKAKKDVNLNHVKMPIEPTWSVRELLDSYPYPKIDDQTLDKLHRLSALTPPSATTITNNANEKDERSALKFHLEGLVKLVNAVRMADVSEATNKLQSEVERETRVPDGRIYPLPQNITLGSKQTRPEGLANKSEGQTKDDTDTTSTGLPSVDEVPHPKGRELLRHSQTSKEGMDYVLPNLIKRR